MSYSQYRQFRSEVHRLYQSGEYSAALNRRETHPDLDHDFPADFDQSLDKALQFIFGE